MLVGTETYRGWGGGKLYVMLHYHHQNYFCIKMDSDENHFDVNESLTVWGKVTSLSMNHNLLNLKSKES